MEKFQWILCPLCPVCGGKTRLKIREDTVLENFPMYYPKCKQDTLIKIRQLCKVLLNVILIGGGLDSIGWTEIFFDNGRGSAILIFKRKMRMNLHGTLRVMLK